MTVTQKDTREQIDAGLPDLRPPATAIVVGAGLAGLAVAYELERRGTRVTVLEASGRPGGRAYTLRSFADDMYAEAGAMTVTPHDHHVHHYADELGVGMDKADLLGTDFWYHLNGRFVRPDAASLDTAGLDLSPAERGMGVTEMIRTYVTALIDELGPDITAPEWAVTPTISDYDTRSVHEVLRSRGASRTAIDLMEPLFLEMRGGDMTAASALSWLRHEGSPNSLSRADDRWTRIAGGTDRLPRAFADQLRGVIRYHAPVVAVRQDDEGASATYADHGALHRVDADVLVMTVPFSAIRHVDVTDARLSDAKRDVMRRLKYADITRVYLQLRRQCWEGHNVSVSTDLPIRWVRDASANFPGPRRVLEALMTGPRARAVDAMSDEERVGFVLDHCESIFSEVRGVFEHGTSVSWARRPGAEGAYVLPEVGHAALMPVIRRAEGRIHFAGEHASFEPNGGSMTSALESAVRCLLEIGAR